MSRRIALIGVLIALAFVFGYVESVTMGGFAIPGIKLGLANIVVVTALWLLGSKEAFMVSLVRVVLSAITFGNGYTFIYSMAGAMGALAVMIFLKKKFKFSVKGISVAGAVTHNVFQIMAAVVLLRNKWLLISYLPWLLVAGVIMGFATGVLSSIIIKRIKPMKGTGNV